ncbi:MAG TPA: DEAD/DEAH box helicase, partial [Planctomycetes bacterium]|nr:DEAD/DEAH box helicase [Planctomycetota bacterium]
EWTLVGTLAATHAHGIGCTLVGAVRAARARCAVWVTGATATRRSCGAEQQLMGATVAARAHSAVWITTGATATRRACGAEQQLVGGMVLYDGKIAEMRTGEGKTLAATLPAALNALSGKGVYIVTVNDYLAKRDRDWMAPVFEYLGLTVGAVQGSMPPQTRKEEYGCDVTYGTNNEFGFDYLRDNMKWNADEQVQKRLNYAIVDEVDSILVDEARTPLIISGEGEGTTDRFVMADRIARQLKVDEHFEVKLKEQQCVLNEEGIARAEKLVGVESFYSDPAHMEGPHLIETALRAHHVYEKDKNYVVVEPKGPDGQPQPAEVVIVDEFTGRLMPGRRWSDGLH